jgi:hypothetical protein
MRVEDFFIIAADLTGAIDEGACFLKKLEDINIFKEILDYFNTNHNGDNKK